MAHSERTEDLFTPRWGWRSVALAVAVTLALYLLLPYLDIATAPDVDEEMSLRTVETVTLPPPDVPPPPMETPSEPVAPSEKPPPEPPAPATPDRSLAPLPPDVDLTMPIRAVPGDFGVRFAVAGAPQELRADIFEVSELDQPPRPLTRLSPMYPPGPRMRRTEGFVRLEFVVKTNGTVEDVEVVEAVPPGAFERAATRAVLKWRFEPGQRDGRAVRTRVTQKVTFQLD